MTTKSKGLLSIYAVGFLSYILTDVIHEVIGHGMICIAVGKDIKFISLVYCNSTPGSFY